MEKKGEVVYNGTIIQGEVFMLGYVRNEAGEMLGKHHALYRATYCGLCRSVKKNTAAIGYIQTTNHI